MKDDEKRFLIDVYNKCEKETNQIAALASITFGKLKYHTVSPRDLINEEGFYTHHKRAWYLLEKWCDKGWYEFGVTLDLGWLTDIGKQQAEGLINQ